MTDEAKVGIQWLVQERDELRGRVALLEAELVRRDEVESRSFREAKFYVEVSQGDLLRSALGRDAALAVRNGLVHQLAKCVVDRSMHRIQKEATGLEARYRMIFTGKCLDPSVL